MEGGWENEGIRRGALEYKCGGWSQQQPPVPDLDPHQDKEPNKDTDNGC